jgi:hypothetical protein
MTGLTRVGVGRHETGAHAFDITPLTPSLADSETRAVLGHLQGLASEFRLAENPRDRFRVGRVSDISQRFVIGTTLGLLDDAVAALQAELKRVGLSHLRVSLEGNGLSETGALNYSLSSAHGSMTTADYGGFRSALSAVADVYGLDHRLPEKLEQPAKSFFSLSLSRNVWGEYKAKEAQD